ncbi:MAG: BrnT family toxin [Pyrinomonadaceae bacterium]
MEFEWDGKKAAANLRKHRVSFEEAATVFNDPLATVYEDPDHSVSEKRFLTIGTSARGRLLHIAFADRGGRLRIINVREVTRRERELYEEEER